MTRIQLSFGSERLVAILDDSAAGRAFAGLLPPELDLTDYNATEKVSQLPARLDTTGAPAACAARAGDLTYYAPWGNLAIFYRDFPSARGLVRLGTIEGGLGPLARSGALHVRIEAAPAEG